MLETMLMEMELLNSLVCSGPLNRDHPLASLDDLHTLNTMRMNPRGKLSLS